MKKFFLTHATAAFMILAIIATRRQKPDSEDIKTSSSIRYFGIPVRPVRAAVQ